MQVEQEDTRLENDVIEQEQDAIEGNYAEVDDEQPTVSEADSEGEHEEKAATQTKVEERIGELTRKRKEAERVAEERLTELQKLQAQIINSQEPVIPEIPDPDNVSDDEFRRAIQRRDQAIMERSQWQVQKQQFDQQQQQKAYTTQQEQVRNLQVAAQTYTARAEKLGISQEELARAGQVINQVGLNDSVAMHILQDEQGAAITRHLGTNIADLLEVANSDPIRAALYIEQKIKPRLTPSKRKSGTPPPPQRKKGGSPDARDKFPLTGGSAKFE